MPRARTVATYLIACVLWGSTWMFVKVGLRDLPPFLFAGVRMLLAAAVLTPFAWRAARRSPGTPWSRVALVGLLQIAVPYGLLFVGQQWTSSGLAAVLFATFPVWILLVARLLMPAERLTAPKISAAFLGVAGIAVLQAPALAGSHPGESTAAGAALIVAAAVVGAFANILVKKSLGGVSPLLSAWCQTLTGAAALLALAVVFESGRSVAWTARGVGALVYLAVLGTAVTYLALYWLIPRVPVAAIGAIPLLDTLVAVSLGAAILGERVGWAFAGGAALVLSGAAIANLWQGDDAPREARAGAGVSNVSTL